MKILKNLLKLVMVIITCAVLLGIYTTFIERHLLIAKKETLKLGNEPKTQLKIVQLTDTQLGEFYNLDDLKKVVKKINRQKADIVVFTGDLIDNASRYNDLYNVSRELEKIESTKGKYAIYGNHDYGGGAIRHYENIMSEAGFTVLKNEKVSIEFEGRGVELFGTDEALIGNHDEVKTMNGIQKDNINILLVHEPDLIDKYREYPIDLALSGHSHGGQVHIPFYGPLKKNVLAKKYTKGFYEIDNARKTKLYVSSGLGNTKVPFRFFNVPEIVVFTLKL